MSFLSLTAVLGQWRPIIMARRAIISSFWNTRHFVSRRYAPCVPDSGNNRPLRGHYNAATVLCIHNIRLTPGVNLICSEYKELDACQVLLGGGLNSAASEPKVHSPTCWWAAEFIAATEKYLGVFTSPPPPLYTAAESKHTGFG